MQKTHNTIANALESDLFCINSSPLNKMATISQTLFPDAFLWKKQILYVD